MTSVTSKSADVTVSGTLTDTAATLNVSGSNVASDYDEPTFGGVDAVGVEVDINMDVDDATTYTVVQENPGLSYFDVTTDDSDYIVDNVKTKTYVGSDLKPYQLLVTDKTGDITVKVYEGSVATGTPVYTYTIKNEVSFAS